MLQRKLRFLFRLVRKDEDMGREVRMVPKHWEHPRDEITGQYIPMCKEFTYLPDEVEEGLRDGWLKGEPPYYGVSIMPKFTREECTHWQMYENTSEGTPLSPPMASPEELAQWLVDNEANAFAGITASYEQWLAVIRGGSVVVTIPAA